MKRSSIVFVFLIAMNMMVMAVSLTLTVRQGSIHLESVYEICERRIQGIVNEAVFYGETHKAILEAQNNGMPDVYVNALASAIADRPYVDVMVSAKDGIVNDVYPKTIEKELLGFDLYQNAMGQLEKTAEQGRSVFCGPYQLHSNMSGFVCITPIFHEDALWGFSCLSIDENLVLEYLHNNLLDDYEYQLRSVVNGLSGKAIGKNSAYFNSNRATTMTFETPNGRWELQLYRKIQWADYTRIALFFVIGCLLSFVALRYLNRTEKHNHVLKSVASVDPLTGAYNRFELGQYAKMLDDANTPYSVLYMDLNKFKIINDTYGHETGDYILKIFVERIKQILKRSDAIFRMGGDEFMVLLQNVEDQVIINEIIERIKGQFEHPIAFEKNYFRITSSIGYAIRFVDGETLNSVIHWADERMYEAKKESRKNK